MIGFKGFNHDFSCNKFKYKLKEVFKIYGNIKLCKKGFHFCEFPLDVFHYYPLINFVSFGFYDKDNDKLKNRYAIVDTEDGYISEKNIKIKANSDSKKASNKIKILTEISYREMIDMAIDMIEHKMDIVKKYFNISESAINKSSTSKLNWKEFSLSKLKKTIAFNGNKYGMAITKEPLSYSITDAPCAISVSRSTSIANGHYSIASTIPSELTCPESIIMGHHSIGSAIGNGDVISYGNNSIASVCGMDNDSFNGIHINGNNSVGTMCGNSSHIITGFGKENILISNPTLKKAYSSRSRKIISTGENSLLIGMFREGYFKGEMGCLFIVPKYNEYDKIIGYIIKEVDGKEILPNTLYHYNDGVFEIYKKSIIEKKFAD